MFGTSKVLLALALLGAPAAPAAGPTADQAVSLAQAKKWDDLFVAFLSAQPKDFSDADRARVAQALLQGAQASRESDAVAAVSMAEKSVAFAETVPALLLAGEMNQHVQQYGEAAKEFDRALALDPKSDQAHVLRAELALTEGEPQAALPQLQLVSKGFDAARVKRDTDRAHAAINEKAAGDAALKRQDAAVRRDTAAAKDEAQSPKGKKGKGESKIIDVGGDDGRMAMVEPHGGIQDGNIGGLRSKASDHFTFSYGTNDRDWGQRADYEGHVMDALEEAYEFVGQTLHANRTQKVQIVLYTKEEYELHFGGTELSRAAGFFSGKIRINGAEEMSPEVRTILVHEYTHAVIDEMVHQQKVPVWVQEGTATWVENAYRYSQGMPGADDAWRTRLRSMAASGRLPKLAELDRGFLGFGNPRMAYATAGKAIELLVDQHGVDTLGGVLTRTASSPWAQNFLDSYGEQATLDDEVREALSK